METAAMIRILDQKEVIVTNSKAVISFSAPQEEGKSFDRTITINGELLVQNGVHCDTCLWLFERLPNDPKVTSLAGQQLAEQLGQGVTHLTSETIELSQQLIPNGDYYVLLSKINPFLRIPIYSKREPYFTEDFFEEPYYLIQSKLKPWKNEPTTFYGFKHFVVPLQKIDTLDKERVEYWKQQLNKGVEPTVLTVGLWDHKYFPFTTQYTDEIDIYDNDMLSEYILDGHHKLYAAALESKPLTLLSYIRKDNYFGDVICKDDFDFWMSYQSDQSIEEPMKPYRGNYFHGK